MTVSELINELSKYPSHVRVVIAEGPDMHLVDQVESQKMDCENVAAIVIPFDDSDEELAP